MKEEYFDKNNFGTLTNIGNKELLSEEDFKKLTNPSYDEGIQEELQIELKIIFEDIITQLKYFLDLKEEYYPIIALWIIASYQIQKFETFPYLFFNAMRGSGKTRAIKLIMKLCNGKMMLSPTESSLFRSNYPLGIDEAERISKKGMENVRELLNGAYKKGMNVIRMRKVSTKEGEKFVEEELPVYRPICLANIEGLDSVLADRCITLLLEKSNKREIIKKIEDFSVLEPIQCRLCRVVSLETIAIDTKLWNMYLTINDTNYTNNTNDTNNINSTNQQKLKEIFKKLDESEIDGRNLELFFPLLSIAYSISEDLFDKVLNIFKEITTERKSEDREQNTDVMIYDFFSQEIESDRFLFISEVFERFISFSGLSKEYYSVKWFGRRLLTLGILKEKKRVGSGRMIKIDFEKARKKMEMFK